MLSGKKSQVSPRSGSDGSPPTRQRQVRLTGDPQAELVSRHREGAFKEELARAIGIHVETVRAIIQRHSGSVHAI